MIQGSGTRGNVGTYKTESLPNITGDGLKNTSVQGFNISEISGAFTVTKTYTTGNPAGGTGTSGKVGFDASHSSSTYQNSAPVQQNALLIQCCIKY